MKAKRAKARECLPSYREPSSRNPRTELHLVLFMGTWMPRTGSPSLHPCPASGGASGFLPASALSFTTRPRDLPVPKTHDASDRLLPLERFACTRTLLVSGSLSQLSLRGRPAESKALRGLPEIRTFHSVRIALADRIEHGSSRSPRYGSHSRGETRLRAWAYFFPRRTVRPNL